ncbi:hypothetical protein N657DRAFT_692850 [Parathielavia appendiculata]|uniref:Uncharacterized protein n=1 Tax=Parathielavia appendiculata TaxID=2587402 RepID=A0AAN6TTZ7_9PEZI|nr:hypothetical protein N657DRAFT_692850 [Parathielavia appendiculata]
MIPYMYLKRDYINPHPDPKPPPPPPSQHHPSPQTKTTAARACLILLPTSSSSSRSSTSSSPSSSASTTCNRRDLARGMINVHPRWRHPAILFMLGWVWPLHCCYIVRDVVREWVCTERRRMAGRDRRLGEEGGRNGTIPRTPGEGGRAAVEDGDGGSGRGGLWSRLQFWRIARVRGRDSNEEPNRSLAGDGAARGAGDGATGTRNVKYLTVVTAGPSSGAVGS